MIWHIQNGMTFQSIWVKMLFKHGNIVKAITKRVALL